MSDKIRLLLVDDHTVMRSGLRMLLSTLPDMEVVGEAPDGETAIASAETLRPDVVLMDITMGEMGGLAATKEIRARFPETKVLVLTMHTSEGHLRQMLEAGATGYVVKSAADSELAVAIRSVYRGEVFIYPTFTRVLLPGLVPGKMDDPQSERRRFDQLSPREKQVFGLLALGHTNREIADQLLLSVKTVATHRARMMEKLGVKSRAALVRYALQNGLLGEPTGAEMV